MKTPKIIYVTPAITESFILYELKNYSSFVVIYHFGSIPKK